jgi:hypothetical protein
VAREPSGRPDWREALPDLFPYQTLGRKAGTLRISPKWEQKEKALPEREVALYEPRGSCSSKEPQWSIHSSTPDPGKLICKRKARGHSQI